MVGMIFLILGYKDAEKLIINLDIGPLVVMTFVLIMIV